MIELVLASMRMNSTHGGIDELQAQRPDMIKPCIKPTGAAATNWCSSQTTGEQNRYSGCRCSALCSRGLAIPDTLFEISWC
eukprot:3009700-Amphidinium_carterae.2